MKKFCIILLLFLFCISCSSNTSNTSNTSRNRNNVNLYENFKIPNELKIYYDDYTSDYTYFDKSINYKPAEKIYVMQSLNKDMCLAYVCYKHFDYSDGFKDRFDNLVLLLYGNYTYDGLEINVDNNEEVKQIGIYKYKTVNKEYDEYKTVPIVVIVDKNSINEIEEISSKKPILEDNKLPFEEPNKMPFLEKIKNNFDIFKRK